MSHVSQIYDCTQVGDCEAGLNAALSAIKGGRLIVMPTDTVYGIGADAFNNQAVAALLKAKHRGPDYPTPVVVGSWDTVPGLVRDYDARMRLLVEAFWPGGLTIVTHQAPSLPWDLGDTRGTVALRMPLHPLAIELLCQTGPMALSSANVHGQPAALSAAQAREQLGASVSVYLDGGPAAIGTASTIVDLSGPRPRILRQGAIEAARISEVLGVAEESLFPETQTPPARQTPETLSSPETPAAGPQG